MLQAKRRRHNLHGGTRPALAQAQGPAVCLVPAQTVPGQARHGGLALSAGGENEVPGEHKLPEAVACLSCDMWHELLLRALKPEAIPLEQLLLPVRYWEEEGRLISI